ncbi:hypothetical protein PR001_g16158 [Phytophthora rubi]|uniref:Uncharacterized protein n=1 Tax=Phytophthora rubi TaxID=129364 RepID=A0A6A3KU16_9STRA|nr:hypothetical protein PR001_g16158 [Phytophthora rubi]
MELLRDVAALPAFAIEVIIAFAASPVVSSPQLSMNLRAVVAAALAALVGVDAAVIAHDAVVPFPQPTPNTTIQTVAVKFNPQIYINNGCHPYPAVDKDGNTSGGLKPTGSQSAGCKGSGYGSQIYGRAVEYEAGMLSVLLFSFL